LHQGLVPAEVDVHMKSIPDSVAVPSAVTVIIPQSTTFPVNTRCTGFVVGFEALFDKVPLTVIGRSLPLSVAVPVELERRSFGVPGVWDNVALPDVSAFKIQV